MAGKWKAKLRRYAKQALFVLVILAVTIALIEVAFRAVGYVLRTDIGPASGRSPGLDTDVVIACFGDSYTAGVGASSPAYSYPAQMERYLTNRLAGRTVHVVSDGVAGSNSSHLVARMGRRLPTYERSFDAIVVLSFRNNDWNLNGCSALTEGYATPPGNRGWYAKLEQARVGKLAVLLGLRRRDLVRRLTEHGSNAYPVEVLLLDQHDEEEYAFLRAWILHDAAAMRQLASNAGSVLVLAQYSESIINVLVAEVASELGIPLIDAPPNGIFWERFGWHRPDGHPNDIGYAAYAAHIAEGLISGGWLAEGRNQAVEDTVPTQSSGDPAPESGTSAPSFNESPSE